MDTGDITHRFRYFQQCAQFKEAVDPPMKYLIHYTQEQIGDYLISCPKIRDASEATAFLQAFVSGMRSPEAQHVFDTMRRLVADYRRKLTPETS